MHEAVNAPLVAAAVLQQKSPEVPGSEVGGNVGGEALLDIDGHGERAVEVAVHGETHALERPAAKIEAEQLVGVDAGTPRLAKLGEEPPAGERVALESGGTRPRDSRGVRRGAGGASGGDPGQHPAHASDSRHSASAMAQTQWHVACVDDDRLPAAATEAQCSRRSTDVDGHGGGAGPATYSCTACRFVRIAQFLSRQLHFDLYEQLH